MNAQRDFNPPGRAGHRTDYGIPIHHLRRDTMKQGKLYTKIVLWIFLAAVLCYFGYYIFSAVHSPLTTVTAIAYEAGTGCYTTGYVVRQESVVLSHYDITTLLVAEGERVAKGQTLATGYRDADAQDRQALIEQTEHQLEQLEYAAAYSSDAADQAALDSEIQAYLRSMSQYVARRDMNAAEDHSAALKGLVLRRSSSESDNAAMDQRIAMLSAQLEDLRSDSSYDTKSVAATQSGYFSGTVDGYELLLTPQSLETLTLAQLDSLEPEKADEMALGKIITSGTWYYVTGVAEELLTEVREGDLVPLNFSSVFREDLTMTVERIGPAEDGRRLLVLSCDRYMQDLTLLRAQSADAVFSSYAGLRVPKEAIRVTEDRRTGVYVLEGRNAAWKYVTSLHDNGESYVVELDKSSTDNLWPGDEIIVDARDLYDGKVVVR